MNLRRSTRRREASSTLAFCEPVTATGPGPWHVRRVPAGEDLRLGGGIDRSALCGRDLHRGGT